MLTIPQTMKALNNALDPKSPQPLSDEAIYAALHYTMTLRDGVRQQIADRMNWIFRNAD